jgi:ketosteroid isomerase-like protein
MSLERETATAFVESYGRTWERWDVEAFVELFSEEVVYVAHPQETVVGRDALRRYLRKEQAEQGDVSVRMGQEIVEGNHVAVEFWVTAVNRGEEASIAGCLIARLDGSDGRCTHFREYWFDLEGYLPAFDGWGE